MISKTLTILMADIQGYTSRTSTQTREENELFIKETQSFVKKHVQEFEGQLVKTMGDGFLVTFESPTNAVKCGLSVQRELSRRNANVLDTQNFIRFRIGICTGEVNIDEKGDVYGDAVNIAARIQSFAEPNHVFIAESTFLSMNQSEVSAMDLGPQQFKNVLREIRVYRVIKDEAEAAVLDAQKRQRAFPSKYMVMIAGLSTGILLMAIVLAAVLFPRMREARPPAPEGSATAPERIETAVPEPQALLSEEPEAGDPLEQPRSTGVGPQAEPIEMIVEKEISELLYKLDFLEWSIQAEESIEGN
jgi:class 3 adenylate cyclase